MTEIKKVTSYDTFPRLAYGVCEAATATSTSPGFIRKAMSGLVPGAPKLKSIKVGRRRIIRDEDLRAWLEEQDRPIDELQ